MECHAREKPAHSVRITRCRATAAGRKIVTNRMKRHKTGADELTVGEIVYAGLALTIQAAPSEIFATNAGYARVASRSFREDNRAGRQPILYSPDRSTIRGR